MKRTAYFVFIAILFVVTSPALYAATDVVPSISVRGQYNDNIDLDREDEKDDFITHIIPRIVIDHRPNSSFDLSLDYSLHFKLYNEHTENNDTSVRDTQNATLSIHAKPLKSFFVTLTDTYERVPIDDNRNTTIDNATTNMTDKNSFFVSPYLELPLTPSIFAELGYRYYNTWFSDDESVDSYRHAGFLNIVKRFSTKLSGEIDYIYSMYRPDQDEDNTEIDDYDRHQGSVVIEYRLTRQNELRAEVGGIFTDYQGTNINAAFWDFSIDHDFHNVYDTGVALTFGSYLSDSSISGIHDSRTVRFTVQSGRVMRVSLAPFFRENDYRNSVNDRKDTFYGVNLDVSRPLGRKMNVTVDYFYEDQELFTEENDEKRTEYTDKQSAGISLDYRLGRSIIATLGYRYNMENSNFDSEDYNNNIASLEVEATF